MTEMSTGPFARSEMIKELAEALAKAQADIAEAEKGQTNPHFGKAYATLADIWGACRKQLTDHGLSVIQSPSTQDGAVVLTTLLLHTSGQWIQGELSIPLGGKVTAQNIGSAITYARRYALGAFASVAPEDDDGNEASKAPGEAKKPPPQQPKADPLRKEVADQTKAIAKRDPIFGALNLQDAVAQIREAANVPKRGTLSIDQLKRLKEWLETRAATLDQDEGATETDEPPADYEPGDGFELERTDQDPT